MPVEVTGMWLAMAHGKMQPIKLQSSVVHTAAVHKTRHGVNHSKEPKLL